MFRAAYTDVFLPRISRNITSVFPPYLQVPVNGKPEAALALLGASSE